MNISGGTDPGWDMTEDKPPSDDMSLAQMAERLASIEEALEKANQQSAVPAQLGGLEAQVSQLTNVVERATRSSESIAKTWMAVPGVIGVIVVALGLGVLLSAFSFVEAGQFESTLWGGVVLVAVGALSATASALVAKPDALHDPPDPTMPKLQ
jgi:hypothetical protein